jgi:hypothetical protein
LLTSVKEANIADLNQHSNRREHVQAADLQQAFDPSQSVPEAEDVGFERRELAFEVGELP